ncbi:DUF1800 domain-containing protein [uncultured Imperialibacter sp.]|uniref:DUF1800 domain-containing protein n=1 Tax=uncultured Imperialibacter sp. TaxID=1672639 RepID=UPI0030DC2617|tara:strand:- start:3257 stop:4609 length:1353 start_codon:yes stop_codon:yes gene_type:complete
MGRMTHQQVKHLYWRAGFGITNKELKRVAKRGRAHLVRRLLKPGEVAQLQLRSEEFVKDEIPPEKLNPSRIRQRQKQYLNFDWLTEIISSDNVLTEKMALFWHGHFACNIGNTYYQQDLVNTIRNNALGNFDTLLRAISKSPAMMQFLNTGQNQKEHPNENFARELLELFTLGIGNYTEEDIKEVAKAFTGWKTNRDGDFFINKKQHDNSQKTFKGVTGNLDGDGIIDIILEQRETSIFICRKIFKSFVNEQVDDRLVGLMADVFRRDYNISELMEFVFMSDWFYSNHNIGCNIKSPIELIVGLSRSFKVQYTSKDGLLRAQKALNQTLFYPPNVAGWPGGKAWIDNSTLAYRLRLPSLILNNGSLDWEDPDGDEDTFLESDPSRSNLFSSTDWDFFKKDVKKLPRTEIPGLLLQSNPLAIENNAYAFNETDSLEEFTLAILSLPEYQTC